MKENKIVDIHMHVVPNYDDGPQSIEESLQMLRMAEAQNVTDIFCTSHSGRTKLDAEDYLKNYKKLQSALKEEDIHINLHKGCEILCAEEDVEAVLYGLKMGIFPTLGESNYILVEFYYDTRSSEALEIVKQFVANGYKPILAHTERYEKITGFVVDLLINAGAMIQVNAYSLVGERDGEIKERARELLSGQKIHFIGSDAHQIDHRKPNIQPGAEYILQNADQEYAFKILSKNASKILGSVK